MPIEIVDLCIIMFHEIIIVITMFHDTLFHDTLW